MSIAIVAIGYNRARDFERLISSLMNADFQGDKVDLILSIDFSGNHEVDGIVDNVEWPFGEKIVRKFKKRQGLRKHIVLCGDYLKTYDALIVFEDDVIAAPGFYNFAKQSINKYQGSPEIAGISLYSHQQNVFSRFPFIPEKNDSDVYFLQVAQSWGQVWMKHQWFEFMSWLDQHTEFDMDEKLPAQLGTWGENSWLKYHIKYCVETNKFFVYPYHGMSSCFASQGEHLASSTNIYQIPMEMGTRRKYVLPDFSDNVIKYDVFFERIGSLAKYLSVPQSKLSIDLYGQKDPKRQGNHRYLLSSQSLNYEIIRSFGRKMRPQEANIQFNITGSELFLYDTDKIVNHHKARVEANSLMQYGYYNKIGDRPILLLRFALSVVCHTIQHRFRK